MSIFQSIGSVFNLKNPVIKTIVTNAAGAAASGLLSVIDAGPTGGALQAAANDPAIAIAYILVQQLAHNLISNALPPGTIPTAPAAPSSTAPAA
jgi:hypothetical protein